MNKMTVEQKFKIYQHRHTYICCALIGAGYCWARRLSTAATSGARPWVAVYLAVYQSPLTPDQGTNLHARTWWHDRTVSMLLCIRHSIPSSRYCL